MKLRSSFKELNEVKGGQIILQPSKKLQNKIRELMNKQVITEEDLLNFMRKKEKIKIKKERSLKWKKMPKTPKT